MAQTQEEKMKELLSKYASFIHQTKDEKVRAVRLCGVLAYLIAMQEQNIDISSGIKQLESFLNKIVKKYTGDNPEEEKGDCVVQ